MKEKILIVEDEFIVANDLRIILENAGYAISGIAASVKEAQESIAKEKPDLVLLDIYLNGHLTGIDLAKILRERNIGFVYLSANSNQSVLDEAKVTQPYGFLVKPFRPKDVLVTIDIAKYRHENSTEAKYRKEDFIRTKLSEIANEPGQWESAMLQICRTMQSCIPFDYMAAGMKMDNEVGYTGIGFLRIGFDEYQVIGVEELLMMSRISKQEFVSLQKNSPDDVKPTIYDGEKLLNIHRTKSIKKLIFDVFGMESHVTLPLKLSNQKLFHFFLYSRKHAAYNTDHIEVFHRIEHSLANAIEAAMGKDLKISHIRNTGALRGGTPQTPQEFQGIIGKSHGILAALDAVMQVAPYDSSVLIMGESGTGKERIAQSIHNLSSRKKHPFIKVNCASIPATLVESELFGHEKGAFTGAYERRIGKFEQANHGTIFLDEIGEMPVDLQVKLLRVLQEREIERVGGKETIKINVRIIAATNKNLDQEISQGRFRLDLYYRLNVFPITLPPLRDRKEDITLLANHFANRFCEIAGKSFSGISNEMLNELTSYSWPGNIRELENVIEQSVILNDGKTEIQLKRALPQSTVAISVATNLASTINTYSDVKKMQEQTEREYIMSILKKTNGRIRGANGAAEILNLKPTTLEAKMMKLGITKEDIF
jgi:DNA-binding NtrC family response regulator